MGKKVNNYAFIDSQNLHLGVREMGWQLDFARFRTYLTDRFQVTKAFLFIGYIPSNQDLYDQLKADGYLLIFKPTTKGKGKIKGNVDIALTVYAMNELYEDAFDKAVFVTGDGDFAPLIEYFRQRGKLLGLVVPNRYRYSSLLKTFRKYIVFLNNKRGKLGKQ